MAFVVAIGILITGLTMGYHLSKDKSSKRKLIVWGTVTMLAIAPFFSFLVAIPFGISVGDGFAAVALLWLMFPVLFIAGLILLIVGIFKKEEKASL